MVAPNVETLEASRAQRKVTSSLAQNLEMGDLVMEETPSFRFELVNPTEQDF